MAEAQRAILNVPTISCAHCKRTIEEAVSGLAGVNEVEVDVAEKSVVVEFEADAIDLQRIRDAIEEEGYEVAGEHVFGSA
jgi:copper chaperone